MTGSRTHWLETHSGLAPGQSADSVHSTPHRAWKQPQSLSRGQAPAQSLSAVHSVRQNPASQRSTPPPSPSQSAFVSQGVSTDQGRVIVTQATRSVSPAPSPAPRSVSCSPPNSRADARAPAPAKMWSNPAASSAPIMRPASWAERHPGDAPTAMGAAYVTAIPGGVPVSSPETSVT